MTDAKRMQNKVLVNGVTYRSVAEAFLKLKLPLAKHQAFRKILKAEKKAKFENVEFELV
jgi:cytidylate kinase